MRPHSRLVRRGQLLALSPRGIHSAGYALFIVGREGAETQLFWRHAYRWPGRSLQARVVNADTASDLLGRRGRLGAGGFVGGFQKQSERTLGSLNERSAKAAKGIVPVRCAADGTNVRRFVRVDFIGRLPCRSS